jgi:phage terminase large subunit GpA-like protein
MAMTTPTKSGTETAFRSLGDVMLDAAVIFLPPERLSVSEAAEKHRKLHNPPAYIGPWKNATTPYMVEPQDMFASRHHNGLVFVGPAQSAKTDSLVLNTLCYTIVCDPADTILYSPSQASSRDFSKRRIDRMHRHTKIVGEQLLPGRHNDNTFDKFYRSGMMFTMSWPSVNEMSGKPVPRVGLTDYDRMPMDVDGEGSPFDLGQKRTTTFKSFGMTVAESSPGKEITDAKWQQETPHQAPPCEGILALYNRGDRRRWYWPCPDCHEFFQGEFSLLMYSDTGTALQRAKTVYMACPKCGSAIAPDKRFEMNRRGVWLREGETITKDGVRGGNPVVSEMASYWLKGVAAAFITWQTLVMKYLNAMEDYARTGAEEALKATVTTDQGDPYLPKSLESTRLPEDLKDQAVELQPRHIPEAVRALFAEIDVQKNRFEVQVHGIAPGAPYKVYVIDRFAIIKSDRLDEDGERRYVKPSDFPKTGT